jgi:hypothetical protein
MLEKLVGQSGFAIIHFVGKDAGDKQQGISREEEAHKKTGFGKHHEKQEPKAAVFHIPLRLQKLAPVKSVEKEKKVHV